MTAVERTALWAAGEPPLSWRQLEDDGDRAAHVLLERWPDVRRASSRGAAATVSLDRPCLGVVAVPSRASVTVLLALHRLGVPVALLHPRWTPEQVDAAARAAGCLEVLEEHDLTAVVDEGRRLPPRGRVGHTGRGLDGAVLFTSGSTGAPKGVVLSRRAFVASARASARRLGAPGGERTLVALPLAHVGGLSCLTRALLHRHAVLLHPRFDPEAILAGIRDYGATALSVVPTMLRTLLECPDVQHLQQLRVILVGGAAIHDDTWRECRARGLPVYPTYGLTETCSQVATWDGRGLLPLPCTRVRIVSPRTGIPCPPGEVGTVTVEGPTLMRGYLGEPPLQGRFDTQDLGFLDEDGHLHILGRRDEVIVTGGENVHPALVESLLLRAPAVTSAFVFGVPDTHWGEVVAAGVTLKTPGTGSVEALKDHLRTNIPAHQRPRRLAVVDDLPRVAGGSKLDRPRCRRLLTPLVVPWAAP